MKEHLALLATTAQGSPFLISIVTCEFEVLTIMQSTFCCICITCPADYRLWQLTMFSQFGIKWTALHHGPPWSVTCNDGEVHSNKQDPMTVRIQTINDHVIQMHVLQALVNVPALSVKTLQQDITSSGNLKYE